MLIWINGPFGGGKTHTAYELERRLDGAVVSDPEHVGFGLHRALPKRLRGDFQDLKAWRSGVVEVLDLVARDQARRHAGPVIVPMTVIDPHFFDETVGALRGIGHDVVHVALLADREVVLDRLKERGWGTGLKRESFAVRRLDDALGELVKPMYAEHVYTDEITVPRVANRIGEIAGLKLQPNHDGPLLRRLRRAATGLRHVRVDLSPER